MPLVPKGTNLLVRLGKKPGELNRYRAKGNKAVRELAGTRAM